MLKLIEKGLFKPELEYMTKLEMKIFNEMVENGTVTIFKISSCETCGKDIVNSKKYCSEECAKINCEEECDDEEDFYYE